MDKKKAAEQLLTRICEIDIIVKNTMENLEIRNKVLKAMEEGFEYTVKEYLELVEDVQQRIVNYHKIKGAEGKITDFVHLPQWYSWSFEEHDKEWWSPSGKYYSLRMSEVINMFLIARFNGGLV